MKRRFFCFGCPMILFPFGMLKEKKHLKSSATCSTGGETSERSTSSDDDFLMYGNPDAPKPQGILSVIEWISVKDRLPEPRLRHYYGPGSSCTSLVDSDVSWNDLALSKYESASTYKMLIISSGNVETALLHKEQLKWGPSIYWKSIHACYKFENVTHWAEFPQNLVEMEK